MKPSYYIKKLCTMIDTVAQETDYSRTELLWSYSLAFLRCGAAIDEYRICRLYDVSGHIQAKQFMSGKRLIRAADRLCKNASQQELDTFGKKDRFNAFFSDYVRRDWIYAGDSTEDQLRAFIARNDVFLAKETGSTQGQNITRWRAGEFIVDSFLEAHLGRTYVLEAFIHQHPTMSKINPTSVNTVRLVMAGYKGRTTVIGGCLRTGGVNAFVDNFHSGGIAFPLDLDHGIVTGQGRDFEGRLYTVHPATGAIVPGFVIPHWAEVVSSVLDGTARLPNVGYIGWDVAVTEEGVEFIKGNVNYPDHTLIQIDNNDAWKRVLDFTRRCETQSRQAP